MKWKECGGEVAMAYYKVSFWHKNCVVVVITITNIIINITTV
jgi:hypothetical protein